MLLSSGGAIWNEILNKEMDRKSKNQGNSSGTGQKQVAKHAVNKRQYATAAEYMAALDKIETGI